MSSDTPQGSSQGNLAPMCLSGCRQRITGLGSPRSGPLVDTAALHVGNLSQHCKNQFADAAPDLSESKHLDYNAALKE